MADQPDAPARQGILPCWRVGLVTFGRLSRVVTDANAPMDARGTPSRGRPERRRGRLRIAQAMRPVDPIDIVEHVEPAGVFVEIESGASVEVVARVRAGAIVGHVGPRRQRALSLAAPDGLGVAPLPTPKTGGPAPQLAYELFTQDNGSQGFIFFDALTGAVVLDSSAP